MFLTDIGIGLLVAIVVCKIGGVDPSAQYLCTGIFGSLLPDIDMLIYRLQGGKMDKWAHKHRDISHYPLITVPILAGVAYYFYGIWHCVILAIAMSCHYRHDIPEPGWGIRLFYPFSKKYIAYRSRDGIEAPQWYAWTAKEQDEIANEYGNDKWVKDWTFWVPSLAVLTVGIISAFFW